MSFVHSLENSSKTSADMIVTITYAKFRIFLKDNDYQSAESALKSLMRSQISFDMGIEVVKTFVNKFCLSRQVDQGKDDTITFYRMLASKFPHEPG